MILAIFLICFLVPACFDFDLGNIFMIWLVAKRAVAVWVVGYGQKYGYTTQYPMDGNDVEANINITLQEGFKGRKEN